MDIDIGRCELGILAGGIGRGGVGGVGSSRATTSSSRANDSVGTNTTDELPDADVRHKRELYDQQQAPSFGRKYTVRIKESNTPSL